MVCSSRTSLSAKSFSPKRRSPFIIWPRCVVAVFIMGMICSRATLSAGPRRPSTHLSAMLSAPRYEPNQRYSNSPLTMRTGEMVTNFAITPRVFIHWV